MILPAGFWIDSISISFVFIAKPFVAPLQVLFAKFIICELGIDLNVSVNWESLRSSFPKSISIQWRIGGIKSSSLHWIEISLNFWIYSSSISSKYCWEWVSWVWILAFLTVSYPTSSWISNFVCSILNAFSNKN